VSSPVVDDSSPRLRRGPPSAARLSREGRRPRLRQAPGQAAISQGTRLQNTGDPTQRPNLGFYNCSSDLSDSLNECNLLSLKNDCRSFIRIELSNGTIPAVK